MTRAATGSAATPRGPAFSAAEYRARVEKARSAMAVHELEALLVTDNADVCYLTGFETCYGVAYRAAIIRSQGAPILVTSDFEMVNARNSAPGAERADFPVRVSDPIAATARVLRERGFAGKRIGIQPQALTAQQQSRLSRELPHADLVSAPGIMAGIKVAKSAAEIAYLREAGRITTCGMEAALAHVAPGRTDNDVAAAAFDALVRGGTEFMCLDPIVSVGERSGIPHTTFQRTLIRAGDSILLEVGACVRRYSAPLMRTAAAAPVAPEVRRAADACRAALEMLLEHMRPGAAAAEVAARAKAAWAPLCDELVWHGDYAYSVGIGFPPDWNDAPAFIAEDSELVLRPGMCFHATTSLRDPARYGAAFSETVLITEDGSEVLTGAPRELRVI